MHDISNLEKEYNRLIFIESIEGLPIEEAIQYIARLVDISCDLRKIDGLEFSIYLSNKLQKLIIDDSQRVVLHYFIANAWSCIRNINRNGSKKLWDWEQGEIEKEIYNLRIALKIGPPPEYKCQLLTNLGNLMDHIGRFIEAIEYWNEALSVSSSFAMARGNLGKGLYYFSRHLYDKGHTRIFLKHAYNNVKEALLLPGLTEDAKRGCIQLRDEIENLIPVDEIEIDNIGSFPLGDSNNEISYRTWCLNNILFLNPINELGPYSISATDVFCLPSIVVNIGEGPYYQGFFNQMKQEFVSARYLYYESIKTEEPHFSDKDVLILNTLDYPSCSLAVEKMKSSFRMAYSLFDKIAFFLNHYLKLGIPERSVFLRTLWYESQDRRKGLRDYFKQMPNWPLRGLFWLSKDLYENKPGFKESIQPDAEELSKIRNHLEHKYLKLHEEMWMGPTEQDSEIFRVLADTLAFSMHRRVFQKKTLRLIKMARAALIYLSLAIHREEQERSAQRGSEILIPSMPMDVWEDEWKV